MRYLVCAYQDFQKDTILESNRFVGLDIDFIPYPPEFSYYYSFSKLQINSQITFNRRFNLKQDFRYLESAVRDNFVSPLNWLAETRNLYSIQYNLFANLAKDYDCCIFCNLPHEGFDIILAQVFEEQGKPWFAPLQIPTSIPLFEVWTNSFKKVITNNYSFFEIFNLEPKVYIDSKFQKKLENSASSFNSKMPLRKPFIYKIFYKGLNFIESQICKKLAVRCVKTNIENTIYRHNILFAFHYQPELTTSTISPMFVEQLDLLEELIFFIQSNNFSCSITIREHPVSSKKYRGTLFYKRLFSLLNSYSFIYFELPKTKLNLNLYSGVITISGTIGAEAIYLGKSVLCSKMAFYSSSKNVFSIEDREFYNFFKNLENKNSSYSNDFFVNAEFGITDNAYIPIYNNDKNKFIDGFKNLLEIVKKNSE